MPDFFTNPNVASAIVERVPCSLAKANADGSVGTHYAMVLLDRSQSVLYVGSECEHTHGEGVQALHELGGGTCFHVTQTFRNMLNVVKRSKDQTLAIYAQQNLRQGLTPVFEAGMTLAWGAAISRHNERFRERFPVSDSDYKQSQRALTLQKGVNLVVGNVLDLPRKMTPGMFGRAVFPRVLAVTDGVEHVLKQVESETMIATTLPVQHLRPMQPKGVADGYKFATRDAAGTWAVHDDSVKHWAADHHTVFKSDTARKERCLFCDDTFERMYRHTQGAKHIDRVLEVVKIACKATSKTGLKLLNNPKHRSMFLKKR